VASTTSSGNLACSVYHWTGDTEIMCIVSKLLGAPNSSAWRRYIASRSGASTSFDNGSANSPAWLSETAQVARYHDEPSTLLSLVCWDDLHAYSGTEAQVSKVLLCASVSGRVDNL
jgi:hypothetical protein